MTAEIAILNKSAIALAADSAVTVSAGSKEEKVFDSADKLFELSDKNPLGIMIYNGMSFMEAPLPNLIRQFRATHCAPVKTVRQAADIFLEFLNASGRSVPQSTKDRSIYGIVQPVFLTLIDRITKKIQKRVFESTEVMQDFKSVFEEIIENNIEIYESVYQKRQNANFVGADNIKFSSSDDTLLGQIVAGIFPNFNDKQRVRLVEIGKLILKKNILSGNQTGIVIAGFGSDDLFPTLVSFEIDGMVCGHLKFNETNSVSIDRDGPKARVIPFAQKEMVERFLYGLDERIERQITTFCAQTVPNIRAEVLTHVEFENDEAKVALEENTRAAEDAFIEGLRERAFEGIRNQSRAEIEDMVEFMPKPELAKMAEALVNLTSIKRRVSRGMETVGGPIDVAVISQSEGFVWIKRKHYFPADLNARYFTRLQRSTQEYEEVGHGKVTKPRKTRSTGRRKANESSQQASTEAYADSSGGDSGEYS